MHMDYEYYDNKLRRSAGIYRICLICAAICLGLLISAALSSCKTLKSDTKEKQTEKDSVRIEYKEKIVKVPVTVYVEVPVEVKEHFSNDSTSHLETSFAVSDASMVWIDGVAFLRHDLKNKPQKIAKEDTVQVVEKEKIVWKTRRVTYTKTEIRQTQISWWRKALMWVGAIAIAVFIIYFALRIYKLRR
jgi:hypothetical protein